MTTLPVCRFPDTLFQFPFAKTGIDSFGPSYTEHAKHKLTKNYGLVFTCMVRRAAHLEPCPDLNTDTFLNALRRFASRRFQTNLIISDITGKTIVGANEEFKQRVNSLDNQIIDFEFVINNTV